jgi:hypothetical protein
MSKETGFKLRVASPCHAKWEDMKGDDQVRYCSLCKLSVYNLPAMDPDKVKKLVLESEGRICGRLYERNDGRVMAADCPMPFQKVRKHLAWALASAFLVFLSLLSYATTISENGQRSTREETIERMRRAEPFKTVLNLIYPKPTPPRFVMGAIAAPSPPIHRPSAGP